MEPNPTDHRDFCIDPQDHGGRYCRKQYPNGNTVLFLRPSELAKHYPDYDKAISAGPGHNRGIWW